MDSKIYLGVIVLLLGYIMFLQQCRSPEVITEPGERVTVVHRDTVQLPPDTVFVEGPTQIIQIPVPEPTVEDTIRTYRQPYRDQFLSAYFQVRTSGYLVDWEFEYTPRVPHIRQKEIQIINRFTTVPTIVRARPGTNLLLGTEFSGNMDQQSVSGLTGIDRRSYIYMVRYDPFQKEVGLSVVRKFGF